MFNVTVVVFFSTFLTLDSDQLNNSNTL